MLKRRLIFGATAAMALLGGAYVGWKKWQPNSAQSDATATLFSLTLPDAQGQAQRLDQWRHQVLVVNFWGTWCPPCVEEMPDFQNVRQSYSGQGVEVIGLAIDNARAVSEFASKLGITYPLLIAGASGTELTHLLGNSSGGLPFTVVLDAKGRVRYQHAGRLKPDRLREMIESSRQLSAK
ncbi:MAG: TlpA disulfide reductase family protein [bacterium]|jgi:peroxiredoxin